MYLKKLFRIRHREGDEKYEKEGLKDMVCRMKRSNTYFMKNSKVRIERWRRGNILRVMTEIFVELVTNINIQVKEG